MKLLALKLCILIAIISCVNNYTYAQQTPAVKLSNYASALNNLRELKPIEKLYLQTDKPYYNSGDTLRFKGYALNADFLTPSVQSGMLYIELDDEKGKSAKRVMVPLANGLGWGNIALDSVEVPNGAYTLRAYTNWMRNFGEDYIFKKTINVAKSADNPLLIKANFKQQGSNVVAGLQFSLLNGAIQAFKDVELKVMNGRRNLSKDKVITGADGTVNVNFPIPEGSSALNIQAAVAGSGTFNIPVSINRTENIDVQFMPEGGRLVAGLPIKVGFKAISENGKSVNLKGSLLDSKNRQVAAFSVTYAGMGTFEFTPLAGETYSAKMEGITKMYVLPAVRTGGTVLSVAAIHPDSLQVTISATADAKGVYNLVAQANGIVCFAQAIKLDGVSRISIPKDLFPTGIAHFILFDNYQPLNERLVFVDHHDELKVSASADKPYYFTRDSIALTINVKDKDGKPVKGNFSVAVTDNSQVKQDSLGSNILNHLLLTSDLKGNIEEPDHYFKAGNESDLDNLLLTQGWVGYSWQEAFHPRLPYTYKPEKEFVITGRVSTAFGKPIERSNVVLVANRPLTFKDTLTDNAGCFIFKDLFPVDTAIFKLQARNKRGKEMNVKIDMDEFAPPVFGQGRMPAPWYLNTDSILLNNSKNRIEEARALSGFRGEGNVLSTVNIKAKRIIPGSKNLNGPGEADQIIDEEELVKANKMTLEELLVQKIKGFQIFGAGKEFTPYVINRNKVSLIIDGFNLNYFYTGHSNKERYFFMKQYLDYFTAEDVTGIEVMYNLKYIANYNVEYFNSGGIEQMRMPPAAHAPIAYLEITTRSKKGPFMQVTPGTYLYKTLPFSVAKQFYSPKYTIANKTTAVGTDLRSTLFWEPNVVTDQQGKATLYFYSADKAANYTIIMEGTDMDGRVGYGKHQIVVRK
ncbi:hypothetical protein ACFQZS_15855 [Mucilaginibacter calamicampi]|uniref:MG2 domain-containing protein n=1 Tax=Mucilaginibacter calamicampi TaxID=1302352 RepID=A0ABW2YZZ7_9SPHI